MATPQQPQQQPIYPHDLSLALDRNFNKFTNYTSARYEELAAQVRIGNDESLTRDTDLANAILRLGERVSKIETMIGEMRQEIKDGFAAQAERHNELMVRVEKLERNGQN